MRIDNTTECAPFSLPFPITWFFLLSCRVCDSITMTTEQRIEPECFFFFVTFSSSWTCDIVVRAPAPPKIYTQFNFSILSLRVPTVLHSTRIPFMNLKQDEHETRCAAACVTFSRVMSREKSKDEKYTHRKVFQISTFFFQQISSSILLCVCCYVVFAVCCLLMLPALWSLSIRLRRQRQASIQRGEIFPHSVFVSFMLRMNEKD